MEFASEVRVRIWNAGPGRQGWGRSLGANARHYAETTFDVDKITDRFEDILGAAAGQPADQPAGRARRRRFWR